MTTIALSAAFTAIAVFILCCYLGLRVAAGYHVILDVSLSSLLAWAYFGTFAGMVTAFMAGLFLSLMFLLTRHFVGYRKLTFHGWRDYPPRYQPTTRSQS